MIAGSGVGFALFLSSVRQMTTSANTRPPTYGKMSVNTTVIQNSLVKPWWQQTPSGYQKIQILSPNFIFLILY